MSTARLALSWLTVLPVRGPDAVDRTAAGRAITVAPLVGSLLGGAAALVLWSLTALGAAPALAGLLAVGALALLTRGMHLDGLADTADGLGSYGPPERARQIMKSGSVGPFGAAALVFALGVQGLAFGALADGGRWWAVVVAVAVARVGVVLVCRRGVDAAPGAGFGALVAGTQPRAVAVAWFTVAAVSALPAVPQHFWQGPATVAVALAIVMFVSRHAVKRFGGLSGDVLGAGVEIAVAIAAVGFSLG
ncbi:adenosylcobinamide-GDP ribazoletransferase [Nocardia thailandica]|uniref:Adenosylcobinamide-GDP ribazoletransferase n=1 Tax=Nocardia thailandica TaxID=257275 RepID=A0ABW6PIL6_9NOCA